MNLFNATSNLLEIKNLIKISIKSIIFLSDNCKLESFFKILKASNINSSFLNLYEFIKILKRVLQ